jgi:hypothetical protein
MVFETNGDIAFVIFFLYSPISKLILTKAKCSRLKIKQAFIPRSDTAHP